MSYKIEDTFEFSSAKLVDEAVKLFQDKKAEDKTRKLRVETVATHSGKIINNRVYPGVYVKAGAKSFVKTEDGSKFNKPFLKNHDTDVDALGRVVDAKYKAFVSGKKFQNDFLNPSPEGSGSLTLVTEITDEDAQEKFLNGTYQTVSIGGSSEGRYCSKCTKDQKKLIPWLSSYLDEDEDQQHCDCWPGEVVDGEKVYLITGALTYHEVSQVNVPADNAAVHIGMEYVEDSELSGEQVAKYVKTAMAHRDSSSNIITPSFSICDAEGNELVSLNTETNKPTKKSVNFLDIDFDAKDEDEVADSSSESQEDQQDNGAVTLSDEEFAEARILNHLATYGYIGDDHRSKIDMDKAQLTDSQKEKLELGYYIGGGLPFSIGDDATLKASFKAVSLFQDEEKAKVFMRSVTEQAATEKLNLQLVKDYTDMTKDEQIATLTSKLSGAEAQVADLEQQLADKDSEYKKLNDQILGQKVDQLIDLRVELECHDAKNLNDEARKELKDKYVGKGDVLVDALIEDLTAEKAAKAVEADSVDDQDTEVVSNPLEDTASDKGEETIEDDKSLDKEPKSPIDYL